jgi:fructoselysine-6-P-deglycase FrlB-like protein
MGQYAGQSPVVVLTNTPESALAKSADGIVLMHAGDERGGVSCRSYTHTQVLLMALEARLTGANRDVLALVAKAAEATADLLDRRQDWLPAVIDAVAGPDGTSVVAPFRRFGNAQQAALMFREGPRRPAVASETAEWSHVDVYLTKTQDYRMLLFAGSAYEAELLRWTAERNATVVSVGAEVDGATCAVRYRHDDVDDVRLLVELVVAELVAAHLWMNA